MKQAYKIIIPAILLLFITHRNFAQPVFTYQSDSVHVDEFIRLMQKENLRIYYDSTWFGDQSWKKLNVQSQPFDEVVSEYFRSFGIYTFKFENAYYLSKESAITPQFADYFHRQINTKEKTNYVAYKSYEKLSRNATTETSNTQQKKYELIRFGQANATNQHKNFTLSGFIHDEETLEPIIGATIIAAGTTIGTSTNANGFFQLNMKAGMHEMLFQAIGKEPTRRRISLYNNGSINLKMIDKYEVIEAINVYANRKNKITQMTGAEEVKIEYLKKMPAVLGEVDVIKGLMALPGIQNTTEVSSGFNVRGGSTDQNLVLIDGAPVMNTSHFFGFFSIFNNDIIKDATLYKSGIPAQLGGRASSIFDLNSIKGNKEKFSVSGGVSPITAKATVQGPISNRISFALGGRTTYSDFILNRVKDERIKNSAANFYDVFGNFHFQINDKEFLKFSAYESSDYFKFDQITTYKYANRIAALNHHKAFNDQLYHHASLTYSRYKFSLIDETVAFIATQKKYMIEQVGLKELIKFRKGNYFDMNMGLKSTLYRTHPGDVLPYGNRSLVVPTILDNEKGLETSLFANNEHDINSWFSVSYGLRVSSFANLGPKKVFRYREGVSKSLLTMSDTLDYKNNELIQFYWNPEFRFLGKFDLGNMSSFKFSYNRNVQYINLISNTITPAPNDIWKLSDTHFEPQKSDQYSLGYFKDFFLNANDYLTFSVETYYRKTLNMLDYKVGAQLFANEHFETEIARGTNHSYGFEVQVERNHGRLSGWLNYVYSRSINQFNSKFSEEVINNGMLFPANYDKPHAIKTVVNYDFFKRLRLSANLNYATGRPVTLPAGVIHFGGKKRVFYEERNAHRLPDYFRLDLSGTYETTFHKDSPVHSSFTVSVVNITGRKNPYSVFFQYNERNRLNAYHLSIYGVPIVTVTYNFNF